MHTLIPKTDGSRTWPRKWWLVSLVVATAIAFLWWCVHLNSETSSHATAAASSKPGHGPRSGGWHPKVARPQAQLPVAPPIRGTVSDIDGAALAGASVAASTFQNDGHVATAPPAVLTDEQGRFELHLPDGVYSLRADKDGYGLSAVIAQNGDDVALVLHRSGAIQGHVYDEHGQPVRQFTIDLVTPAPESLPSPPPLWSARFNSPDGSFHLDRLPAWGAVLRASSAGYAPAFSPPVTVPPGHTEQLDLTLPGGCPFLGRVVDEKGFPVSAAQISAEARMAAGIGGNLSVATGAEAQSDARGEFRLDHVPRGDVIVRGYHADHAASMGYVRVGDCNAFEPFTLIMSGGGSVTGIVRRSDRTPVPRAKVLVSHPSIGFVNTLSDSEGRYRFDHLPPVLLRLDVQQAGRHTSTHLAIADAETIEKDLMLFGWGSGELRGRITAGEKPLAGAQLTVAANRGPGGMDLFHPRTGKDGTYSLRSLPDGAYIVSVSSTNRFGSALIQNGSVETVDLDITAGPEHMAAPAP